MAMMTMMNTSSGSSGSNKESMCSLEKDYYGCYCLKFIVKNGTYITEEKVCLAPPSDIQADKFGLEQLLEWNF